MTLLIQLRNRIVTQMKKTHAFCRVMIVLHKKEKAGFTGGKCKNDHYKKSFNFFVYDRYVSNSFYTAEGHR